MATYDNPDTNWWDDQSNATADPSAPPATTTPTTPPPPGAGAIPTNPDGTQVGAGSTWDPTTGAPTAPPGYHWDPNLAMMQPDAPGATPPPTTGAPAPPPGMPPPTGGGGPVPGAPDFGSIYDKMTAAAGLKSGSGAPAGVSDALYSQLLARAQQGENVDPSNPNIKQQMDPYSAQTERDRRDYVDSLAEARGPMGSIEGEKRLSYERAGQQNANFQGQLIGRELTAKRDEIQQALTQLGSQMTADQQQQLSKELGVLNGSLQKYGIDSSAHLQQEGIDSNNDQFASRFGLDAQNQASYWDSLRRGIKPTN